VTDRASADGGRSWHARAAREALAALATEPESGLTRLEAARRLSRVGPNRVADYRDPPLWRLVLDQFRSLVVLLLLAAASVAWVLAEQVEAVAILAALAINAAIGFGSEWRARRSLARLRSLAVPQALVRREGRTVHIPASELVPGDIVLLEAGGHVPADLRLIRSTALRVTEAALTGESEAALKDADAPVAPDAPLAERPTMVYLGTAVVAGSGLGVVTATGVATELGRIGQLVALAGERETPLERQVEQLGRRLIGLTLAICALVGVVGILHGEPIGLMLETAISLAVAAIPEGLPAVTAVALAAGLWRLARAGALVRRLSAVETLGGATVICADKTGTMTANRMSVAHLVVDDRAITVGGSGTVAFAEDGRPITPASDPPVARLLTVGSLVNDASIESGPAGPRVQGDPTETALVTAAMAAGLDPAALRRAWPRRREIPFDPATRLMATLHDAPDGRQVLCVKGAPGVIVERSRRHESGGGTIVLDDEGRSRVLEANRALAARGTRVLALAWRPEGWPSGDRVDDLTLLGLVALTDPPRPGVQEAIARCRQAGIRTVMLTGDQRLTAEAVGRDLGLPPDAVRSRVSPEQKLALVEALQADGDVVAMTGDGVNDAPALARADIGIAMGRGTDVAREAADLVLTDDNFSTIVRAVEEGRVIYANLRKVIRFLFSCNLSEIATIFVAILLGYPTPLLPLQILWVNLVTDILPAMALVRDPAEPDIMRRAPRDPREALVTWRFGRATLLEGILLAAGVLSAYLLAVSRAGVGPRAGTVAFVALVIVHPLQAMHCRSDHLPWWRLPANGLSWGALAALLAMQWLAVTWPPLGGLLDTTSLDWTDWGVALGAAVWPVVLLEAWKAWGPGGGTGAGAPHTGPNGPGVSRWQRRDFARASGGTPVARTVRP
jgi:Ca2+-transporting ATPase